MMQRFKISDKVGWHIEFGTASGTITRVHTHDTDYNGQVHHCSEVDPQYEIRSLKTDHIAMHEGQALHHLK